MPFYAIDHSKAEHYPFNDKLDFNNKLTIRGLKILKDSKFKNVKDFYDECITVIEPEELRGFAQARINSKYLDARNAKQAKNAAQEALDNAKTSEDIIKVVNNYSWMSCSIGNTISEVINNELDLERIVQEPTIDRGPM